MERKTTEELWCYNSDKNIFERTDGELFSVFPTIFNKEKRILYCRKCFRWEYITGIASNRLQSQCGQIYKGPFLYEDSLFYYGYKINRQKDSYNIKVLIQVASTDTNKKRRFERTYFIDTKKHILYKDGEAIFEAEDLISSVCKEVLDSIIDEMGDNYKSIYGIKPTVASKLVGLNLLVGYLVSPFNINFYKISHHWGLNPYMEDFISLSSGNSPNAENEMFECLNIKPTKKIRKMYQENPYGIVSYSAMKDLGFTDVNLLLKAFDKKYYKFFDFHMISFNGGEVHYELRRGLSSFVADLLPVSDQKTVWNSIERTINHFNNSEIEDFVIIDGINLYLDCRQNLTVNEKKEIMREGFNQYIHDYLIRRAHELRVSCRKFENEHDENETYIIEKEFLDLEFKAGDDKKRVYKSNGSFDIIDRPDEERYCFYVAEDKFRLKEIGASMHNCVGGGGYHRSVKERHCTIVYAMYKNQYKICIEVTPGFTIRQSLGPCNSQLQGEALKAYKEWCKEKDIKFVKAFGIRGAV